jgi:hypothetical protein
MVGFGGEPVRRRDFITLLGGAVAGLPLVAQTQQTAVPWVPHLLLTSEPGVVSRSKTSRCGFGREI